MGDHTIQCWSCGTRKTLEEIRSADGYCPECEVEIDLAEYYPKLASDYDALQSRLDAAEAERASLQIRVNELQSGTVDPADVCELEADRDKLRAELAALKAQQPVAIANKGDHAFWVKWTDAGKDLRGPGINLYTAPQPAPAQDVAQPAQQPDASELVGMVDRAMVEMQNIYPPMRRRDCERLILAALSAYQPAQQRTNDEGGV